MMQERGKARRIVGVLIQATFLLSSFFFFFFPDKVVTLETTASKGLEEGVPVVSTATGCNKTPQPCLTATCSNTPQPCPTTGGCNNKRLAAIEGYTIVTNPRSVVYGSSAAPPPPQHQIQVLAPAPNPAYPPHTNFSNNNPRPSPAANPPHTLNNSPRLKIGKTDGAKKIIVVVSVSTSGAIIIAIAICCFLKRRFSQNGPNHEVENLLLQRTPKRYRYSEIKKMTKSFSDKLGQGGFSDKLGQGGFGSVYKGTLPGGCHVAVKILTEIDSNGEEFINEVDTITRTSHVNIVSLLGFCDEGNKRALVYEFMPNKSLDNFLGNHNGDGGFMDLKKLYEIAVGIAKGLEYLHTGCNNRIVHFDIKPQNILLDEDLCPKISDFGLAKLCKKKQSVLSVLGTRGTAGYIAPEVFSRNFGGVSHKSDVYSYGMMLLEMAGAIKNSGTVVIQSSENYFPDRIYEKLMIDVTNGDLDDKWMMIGEEEERRRKMMLIGFWCIQTSPSERPYMSKVVEMLEGSLDSIQIPPKPSFCSPVIPDQENSSSSSSAHADTENLAAD